MSLKCFFQNLSITNTVIISLAISFLLLPDRTLAADEPIPYTAEYSGVFKGLKLTLKRELKKLGNHHYSISNSAKNSFARFYEASDFHLFSDNRIQPTRYQYQTRYGPIKKQEDVRFDWKKKIVKDIKSDKSALTLNEFMADRISYQVLLKQIIKSGKKKNISIDLYNRGRKGSYHFKVLKETVISTPAGRFKAIPVMKVYSDKSKMQTVWLAKDHDYILLKLQQKDKKGRYEINLNKFSMKQ